MNTHAQAISDDLSHLSKYAKELISATTDATGEKIVEARKRLASVLERGKEMYGEAENRAVAGCSAADVMMRRNLYPVIALLGTPDGLSPSRPLTRRGWLAARR